MNQRNRTERGREFAEAPPAVSKEFLTPPNVAPEFEKGFVPTERFGGPSAPLRPRPEDFLKQKQIVAGAEEFTPLGRISQIWLGARDIDFKQQGPMLGFNASREFVIPVPVFSLPARNIVVNQRGRRIWNTEQLSESELRNLQRGYRVKPLTPTLESYATRRHSSWYVLEPLAQILFRTLDADSHFFYLNFDRNTRNPELPVLLYEKPTGQLKLYGVEGYQFA